MQAHLGQRHVEEEFGLLVIVLGQPVAIQNDVQLVA